jgi:hypothetical protein
MRFRFRLLFLIGPGLLAGCTKDIPPLRLDFVGATGLTSGNQTVPAGDTLTTRLYTASENPLTRLRITVNYEPNGRPIIYPIPASLFDPASVASQELVFLDSVLNSVSELSLQTRFGARTTSGTERWTYTASDAKGNSTSRAYRLTVRKSDSLAVYHSYKTYLRPPGRIFMLLRPGLVLPRYSVNTLADNQQQVDLVVPSSNDYILAAPAAPAPVLRLSAARWPLSVRRRTRILLTNLSSETFTNADTAEELRSGFGGLAVTADSLSTGPLAKDQVLAFRTGEGYYGLLQINDLVKTPLPLITCTVRIQK